MANIVQVGVGIIIFNRNAEVLFGKRKGAHGAGTWSLPGGRMEYNELPEITAVRELIEETGLHVGIPSIWKKHPFNSCVIEGQHWVTLFFYQHAQLLIFDEEPKVTEPDKCEEWQWFDMSKLPTPLFPPLKKLAAASGWK